MSRDLELLQKYEPVVCYTLGELYYPCAVDEFVKRSSLWQKPPEGQPIKLQDWGELTLKKLATYSEVPDGHSLYLRFVEEPMDMLQYSRWRLRPDRPAFYAKARLARVGIFSRILDSLFDLSLLFRGTVPGGTTAAADLKYQEMRQDDPRRAYYGRIVRVGGYTVLHYLFFYPMNDWRSSFYGVNDHVSDWEQIFIYLSGNEDKLEPRWVAYASHDFSGDDLRRRWDDPELQFVDGTHPVVYAGAGSHASYFLPGEYMMNVEPSVLRPIRGTIDRVAGFWYNTLNQGPERSEEDVHRATSAIVSIPFVDYARGDGICIGPEQAETWTPLLLSEETPWVNRYRGLWGLDTNDPFGGERAPSGPKYNRSGSVRRSWYDPLGWAGLDKVTPREEMEPTLQEQIEKLTERERKLNIQIRQQRDNLRHLALEVDALEQSEFVSEIQDEQRDRLEDEEAALQSLYSDRMSAVETRIAVQSYLAKIRSGNYGDPQAHLHHQHKPAPPVTHLSQATELWSAISGGLLLLILILLVVFFPPHWAWWLMGIGFVFFALEATARGYLSGYLLNVSILLAIVTTIILLYEFWWLAILAAIAALIFFMVRENLLELRYNRAVERHGAGQDDTRTSFTPGNPADRNTA